jgi:hypothetical protein
VLLAILAILAWRRGLHKVFPAFFVYLVFEPILGLTLYVLDILPAVSAHEYWSVAVAGLLIEVWVKLAVIWEIFFHLVRPEPTVAKIGRRRIVGTGVRLIIFALAAAMRAPIGKFPIFSYTWILGQSIYLVEAGILLFIFLFATSFQLAWDKRFFGIALGLSLSACVGLGIFAICANGIFFKNRYLLDYLEMGTYHICVLIWFYFLLSAGPHTLAIGEARREADPFRRRLDATVQQGSDGSPYPRIDFPVLLRIPNNTRSEVTFTALWKG